VKAERAAPLSAMPWWTRADAAELVVLADALTDAAWLHKERCAVCRERGPWCEPLRDAFDAMLSWRRRRILRSRAEWLAVEQNARRAA
jgi:hypothetical protein